MKVIGSEREYTGKGAVLALGMFDGVHVGHRALIGRAVEMAREMGADSMVCTFDRHPRSVLFPDRAPAPLMTGGEQLAEFEKLGVDWALVKRFDMALADESAETFIASLVCATGAKGIVCGEDYTFGRAGKGDPAMLRDFEEQFGYRLEVIPYVKDGDDIVSSTLIRKLMEQGDMQRAARLMGREEY